MGLQHLRSVEITKEDRETRISFGVWYCDLEAQTFSVVISGKLSFWGIQGKFIREKAGWIAESTNETRGHGEL